MSLKIYKPRTPGTRGMTTLNYRELLSGHRPTKALVSGGKRAVGRNAAGRITTRHKGGGHKRKFRVVDFIYDKKNIPAKISSIEYDPFRSSFIGLSIYADGEKRYVIVPQKIKVGDTFLVSIKKIFPRRSLPSNTIRSALASLDSQSTQTARSAMSYFRRKCVWAIALLSLKPRRSRWETDCRSASSPWERLSTTLN